MRITFDPSNAQPKSAGNINMSLDDVIKANNAQNTQQKANRQGNDQKQKWIQGGTARDKPNFQRQNQQPRNNPRQQGFGGGQKPFGTGQRQFGAGQRQFGTGQRQFGTGQRQFGAGQKPSGGLRPFLSNAQGKLVISNLDPKVTEDDMLTLFTALGEVKEAKIYCDRDGVSLGSAQIIFEQYGDAVRGMQRYNGVTLDGRPMQMHIEKIHGPRPQRTPNANVQAGNAASAGGAAKPVKRLQRGPQQQIETNKPTIVRLTKGPQQQQQQQTGNRNLVRLTGNKGQQQPMRNTQQQTANSNQGGNNVQLFTKKNQHVFTNKNQQIFTNKNQQIFTNKQQGNNQQVINIQTRKNVQQQQNVGGAKWRQQGGGGGNWTPNVQIGVTQSFSYGVPAPGVGLMQSPGSLTGMSRPGVLDRLDGGSSQSLLGPAPIYQAAPATTSVLDRLDGGHVQTTSLMGNPPVLSRLGGTVVAAANSGSILSRVGPKQAAPKPVARPAQTAMAKAAPKVINPNQQKWSFAVLPGTRAVAPALPGLANKLGVNKLAAQRQNKPVIQMQKKNVIQKQNKPAIQNRVQQQGQKRGSIQQQQQQGQNKRNKLPTAAELDAELDDYLSKMNAKK